MSMHKTFCLVNLQPSNPNCFENSIWIAEKPCCSITAVCWSFVEWKHKNCFLRKGIEDAKMWGLCSLWFVLLSKIDCTSEIKLCWMIIAENITTVMIWLMSVTKSQLWCYLWWHSTSSVSLLVSLLNMKGEEANQLVSLENIHKMHMHIYLNLLEFHSIRKSVLFRFTNRAHIRNTE